MNRSTPTRTNPAIDFADDGALMSAASLATENARFAGSGGVSQGARRQGFLPAFLDRGTGEVYLSRFADGRLAPIHVLDGLPVRLVVMHNTHRVTAAKASVIAGFVRSQSFYTRAQAALAAGHADISTNAPRAAVKTQSTRSGGPTMTASPTPYEVTADEALAERHDEDGLATVDAWTLNDFDDLLYEVRRSIALSAGDKDLAFPN